MSIEALEWPEQGNSRVPYRVFADPDIYQAELDRIFLGPSWQYLALADQLPEPGDYNTTFLGEAPALDWCIGELIGSRIGRGIRAEPQILGTTSQILHNNWKLYVENVKDTYHATLLHTFFATFRVSRLTAGGGVLVSEGGRHHP